MSVTPESTLRLRDNLYELWRNGINQFIIGYAHGLDWSDENLLKYEQGMLDVCELYLEMKYNKQYFRITTFEEETICDIKEFLLVVERDADGSVLILGVICMVALKCVRLWDQVKGFCLSEMCFKGLHGLTIESIA